jgi:hypothetical protein
MALFVEENGGRFPNGASIVRVQFEPGNDTGRATLYDAAGHEVASTVNIPNITSTHVWHNKRWAVDCAGWQPYRVIYY